MACLTWAGRSGQASITSRRSLSKFEFACELLGLSLGGSVQTCKILKQRHLWGQRAA